MKKSTPFFVLRIASIMLFTITFIPAFATYDDYFTRETLRMDYIHAGNHQTEFFYLDDLRKEPYWGGSMINLIDTFYYGNHFLKVFDINSDSLLYSRGYSSLFNEWQTTEEAKITSRAFTETVVCPFPKKPVRLVLMSRDDHGTLSQVFEYTVDPANPFIKPELKRPSATFDTYISGDPTQCVDIVILPEGYQDLDMGKFIHDCQVFADILFSFDPYKAYKNKFNIRGVLASSRESGSDIPRDSVWVNTIMNSSFYTFDSERYCMTYDNKSVRDLAANAPYDQIYILVNSGKYGGGAIYNYYSMSVNSNLNAAKIFIHEFGHGFAGLGDEYYNSEVAYSEFYPTDIEPWEPNLTTLVDFKRKWSAKLLPDTPIPTPESDFFMNRTGVFEGGGYAAKGVYRPAVDCLMNSFKGDHFCEVCEEAIEKMILFYSE